MRAALRAAQEAETIMDRLQVPEEHRNGILEGILANADPAGGVRVRDGGGTVSIERYVELTSSVNRAFSGQPAAAPVKPTYEQLMADPTLLRQWGESDPEFVRQVQDEAFAVMRAKKR